MNMQGELLPHRHEERPGIDALGLHLVVQVQLCWSSASGLWVYIHMNRPPSLLLPCLRPSSAVADSPPSSSLCAPSGDTYTRWSAFDAILAGCVMEVEVAASLGVAPGDQVASQGRVMEVAASSASRRRAREASEATPSLLGAPACAP